LYPVIFTTHWDVPPKDSALKFVTGDKFSNKLPAVDSTLVITKCLSDDNTGQQNFTFFLSHELQ